MTKEDVDDDVNSKTMFDWQAAQELDMRIAELITAKKIARAETTVDDAVEYLVCRGWSVEEARKSLGVT